MTSLPALDDVESAPDDGSGYVLLRHAVPPALAGLVARISGYRETMRRPIRMTETASLIVPIIIGFGEPFEIALNREPDHDDRLGSFTAGLTGGPVRVRSHGAAHCLQIDLTPLGAYRFFGRPMHELTERMVHLDDLQDRTIAGLRERLGAERSWAVASRLPRPRAFRGRRPRAGSVGRSRLGLPAYRRDRRRGADRRHRRTARVEPKAPRGTLPRRGRLAPEDDRAHRPLQPRRGDGPSRDGDGWADIATACGYADQAHLVREFTTLAGATPAAWQAGG